MGRRTGKRGLRLLLLAVLGAVVTWFVTSRRAAADRALRVPFTPPPPAAQAPEPAARSLPPQGAHGPGSADPLADGSSPHPAYGIKGNADSMLFHSDASPYFERTKPEAWFDTEENARAAGFTGWDD